MRIDQSWIAKWYSNDRASWVVARATIAAVVGLLVAWAIGAAQSAWVVAVVVPSILASVAPVQLRSKRGADNAK